MVFDPIKPHIFPLRTNDGLKHWSRLGYFVVSLFVVKFFDWTKVKIIFNFATGNGNARLYFVDSRESTV